MGKKLSNKHGKKKKINLHELHKPGKQKKPRITPEKEQERNRKIKKIKHLLLQGFEGHEIAGKLGIGRKNRSAIYYYLKKTKKLTPTEERFRNSNRAIRLFITSYHPKISGKPLNAEQLKQYVLKNLGTNTRQAAKKLNVHYISYTRLLKNTGWKESNKKALEILSKARAMVRPARYRKKAVNELIEFAREQGYSPGKKVTERVLKKLTASFVHKNRGKISLKIVRGKGNYKEIFENAFPGYEYISGKYGVRKPIIRKRQKRQ